MTLYGREVDLFRRNAAHQPARANIAKVGPKRNMPVRAMGGDMPAILMLRPGCVTRS